MTKDQKNKIQSLWKEGLKERNKDLLIQAWEIFQVIDPTDIEFEMELKDLREKEARKWAQEIDRELKKEMYHLFKRKEIFLELEGHVQLGHPAFYERRKLLKNYQKGQVDWIFGEVAKILKKNPLFEEYDKVYDQLAHKEIKGNRK